MNNQEAIARLKNIINKTEADEMRTKKWTGEIQNEK